MTEMPTRLAPQPWMTAPDARRILAALTSRDSRVRFVGGCVRNALIGAAVGDLDVATPDDPETITALLTEVGLKAVPSGVEHGTVTAVAGDTVMEVTTLRRDVETDGRHATVAFTSDWEADARRRDFTMNAIYADPDGTLYDPVNGIADLFAGRVRFIGDAKARIAEDFLRILRFFRFHVWYGQGSLDADALAAITQSREGVKRLSGERVQKEVLRLLSAPAAAEALVATVEALRETGVLERILPTAVHLSRFAGLTALDEVLPQGSIDAILRLGALTLGSVADAHTVSDALRLSNRVRARLVAMADDAEPFSPIPSDNEVRRALYRLGAETFTDRLLLKWADPSAPENSETGKLAHLLDLAGRWSKPVFLLTGQDVLDAGVPAGPEVGRLLTLLEEEWIAQDFRARRKELLRRLASLTPGDAKT